MVNTCGKIVSVNVNQHFFHVSLKEPLPCPMQLEALTEPGKGETGEKKKAFGD